MDAGIFLVLFSYLVVLLICEECYWWICKLFVHWWRLLCLIHVIIQIYLLLTSFGLLFIITAKFIKYLWCSVLVIRVIINIWLLAYCIYLMPFVIALLDYNHDDVTELFLQISDYDTNLLTFGVLQFYHSIGWELFCPSLISNRTHSCPVQLSFLSSQLQFPEVFNS